MFNDNLSKSIAEAAKKVMDEELKGQQHKIDANKNNKIDAHDFKLLRAKKDVKEEMQKADVPAYLRKQKGESPLTVADVKSPRKDSISHSANLAKARNEEVEQVTEADIEKTATGMKVYGSSYGNSVRARREQVKKSVDTAKGPKMKDLEDIESEKKKKKFSEMVETYVQSGIQGLFEGWKKVKEEATNDEFKSELNKQQAKADGKAPQADIAKASVQSVQQEEVEQLDELSPGTLKSYTNKAGADLKQAKQDIQSAGSSGDDENFSKAVDRKINRTAGIKAAKAKLNAEEVEQVEERSLSEPEMKKREEVVKSMKKGIQGFKDRYGDRAKEVMYATATKIAKKD